MFIKSDVFMLEGDGVFHLELELLLSYGIPVMADWVEGYMTMQVLKLVQLQYRMNLDEKMKRMKTK